MQQKSTESTELLELISHKYRSEAYILIEKILGGEVKRQFFLDVLTQSKEVYGIALKNEKGIAYFEEIYLPDLKKQVDFFKKDPDAAKEILINTYAGTIFAVYGAPFSSYNNPSSLEFLMDAIIISEENGLTEKILDKESPPYSIKDGFIKKLSEFKEIIDKKEIENARNYFKNADKEFTFSLLELIAVKNLHLSARRLYFLTETDPEFPTEKVEQMRQCLSDRVGQIIKYAKKANKAFFFTFRYENKLVNIVTRYETTF